MIFQTSVSFDFQKVPLEVYEMDIPIQIVNSRAAFTSSATGVIMVFSVPSMFLRRSPWGFLSALSACGTQYQLVLRNVIGKHNLHKLAMILQGRTEQKVPALTSMS